jgi:hypothetical protein
MLSFKSCSKELILKKIHKKHALRKILLLGEIQGLKGQSQENVGELRVWEVSLSSN